MTKDELLKLYKECKTQTNLAKKLNLTLTKLKQLLAEYGIIIYNKRIEKAKNTFIEKVKKIHGNKYDYSEVNYIRSCIKVKIKCKTCNKTFWQTPNNHLMGQGCPICKLHNLKYSQQKSFNDFVEDARKFHGDSYEYFIDTYDGSKHKMKILCKKCNKYFYQSPDKHLIGHGCPVCNTLESHKKQLKSTEKFIEEAKYIHGEDYDYSQVKYLGRSKSIKIKCNQCGEIFEMQPYIHLRGSGCKKCHNTISKGEKKITKWLKKNNFLYIVQKRFNDCKYKQCLPFDFYLPLQNICIEYQGKQHFEPNSLFDKTKESFEQRRLRDKIKKDYCKKKGIKLLEINYNESIEERLKMELFSQKIM